MAHPMGFYSKHDLNVEVIETAAGRLSATRPTPTRRC
jgi:hypothetical protein